LAPFSPQMSLSGALGTVAAATRASDVLETLDTVSKRLGFNAIILGHIVNQQRVTTSERLLMSTWPEALLAARLRISNVTSHDPIACHVLRTDHSFFWNEASRDADATGRKLLKAARDHDMHDGLTVPVKGRSGTVAAVSFGTDRLDIAPDDIAALSQLSRQAFHRLEVLAGREAAPVPVVLTAREIDIVLGAANGLNNKEIARAFDISPFTVRDHLVSVASKLKTKNRTHTVAVAIARGLIAP
jgi:DNA-binding CsgD family transcriptional regulator